LASPIIADLTFAGIRCRKIGVTPLIPELSPSRVDSDGVPARGEAPAEGCGVVARTAGVDGVEVFADEIDDVVTLRTDLSSLSVVDVGNDILNPTLVDRLVPAMEEPSYRLTKPSV
jgi:hypothetical protein